MRIALLSGLLLAVLTGCTSAADDSEGAPSHPAAQSWALADGAVTDDEYRKAIDGFTKCVRDAGFPAEDPVISPIDGLTLLYDIPPTGDPEAWSKAVEGCNDTHVSHIEPAYVEARRQTMDPLVRDAAVKCLRDKGTTPAGSERSVKELVDATGRSEVVLECVSGAARQLFPDLPGFLKIRW